MLPVRDDSGDGKEMLELLGWVRKQGVLLCEECVGHGTLTKGDEATATEKDAGANGSGESVEVTDSENSTTAPSPLPKNELGDGPTGKNARETGALCPLSAHKTNRSWIYTCTARQRHLCIGCHAREVCTAPATRATGRESRSPAFLSLTDRPTPPAADNLMDPRGRDRRYAAIRLLALDSASSESQHSSPNPETLEQGCPLHPSPDSAGTWPQAPRRARQHQGRIQKTGPRVAKRTRSC